MSLLDELRPAPHPLWAFLKVNGVTLDMVAFWCERSRTTAHAVLSGVRKPSSHMEAKLQQLADRVKAEAAQE
jgi:hypothetical protein